MARDPRSHRRYIEARAAWLSTITAGNCCLCGKPVDLALPATYANGPTVEHKLPVRVIMRTAPTWLDAVAMCCDTSMWGLAHRRCQSRQGALVSNVTRHGRSERTSSRAW